MPRSQPPASNIIEADFQAVQEAVAQQGAKAPTPGRLLMILAVMLGLVWIGGVAAAALITFGQARLLGFNAVEAAGLGALALLPACMIWIAGAMASEAAKTRAEAKRLADAANQLLAPAPGAEAATRRLAVAVRGEIAALDRALEQTIARLREVEGHINKQQSAVRNIADQARAGADQMILGMERERAELVRLAQDLNAQASSIGQSISRHTKAIADAARDAETEVRAADEALDARLSSFGAAAALISDRTHAVTHAAQASADSALKLEQALATALDVLAKATQLTDAARESAAAATLAANSTATSVHNTTARAVEDAKRAAEMIRGEASAVEREASSALERLRDAANSARTAAHDVRGAVDPRSTGKPLRANAPTNFMLRPSQPTPPPPQAAPPPAERPGLFGEPAPQPAPARPPAQPAQAGAWTWRDLLTSMDSEEAPPAPPRQTATEQPREDQGESDPIARLQRAVTEPRLNSHPIPAAAAIERAGVRLNEALSRGALDRIAQRARNGTQARRRAVRDAAPDAVNAVADFLDRDANARQEAAHFLKAEGARIAELLSRGRATMSADATRIFLLLDAAAG